MRGILVVPPGGGYCAGILISAWMTFSAAVAVEAVTNAPRIACREPVYYFGEAENTQTVAHVFMIENEGNAPLHISRVSGCCGVTTKLADPIVLPGKSTSLQVEFALSGREGALSKSLYLASDDPARRYFQLRLTGTAISVISIQPRRVDFGPVFRDAVAERRVTLVCNSNIIFRITNIVSSVSRFSAVGEGTAVSNVHSITVRTAPPLPNGMTRGELWVMTDHAVRRKIVIPVMAMVASDMIVVPKEITIRKTEAATVPVTRYIALRSRSGKPFKVVNVELPDSGMSSKVISMGALGYRIHLEHIMPSADLEGEAVRIKTDAPEANEILVPFVVLSAPGAH